MNQLEMDFTRAMHNIYHRAKHECKYPATRFLRMLQDDVNGVKTAKRLLAAPMIQSGLGELYEHRRLDLTVEAHVLRDDYVDLFTPEERQEAARRLEGLVPGYIEGHREIYTRHLEYVEGTR